MIHHVVVTGDPGVVDELAPRLLPALHTTRYFQGEVIERRGAHRSWAAATISVPDPLCATRLAVDGDSLAIVNGPAIATRGSQDALAEQVRRDHAAGGSALAASRLSGSYNAVAVAPEQGLTAFGDLTGIAPLYWHQGAGFAAFSNRTTTLAALTGATEWDLRAFGWIVGCGTLHGERMPAQAATHLPPGLQATVPWGGDRVTIGRSPSWVWPEPGRDEGRPDLTSAEWDDVTHELIGNFRVMRSFGRPVRLALSGGKDSRLCLALAKAAGLADVLQVRTNGTADSPEVECAAFAARVAGFPHERIGPPGEAASASATPAPSEDFGGWWERLRQHSYRYDAIVNPWDGMTDPIRSTTLNIRGIGGELYRRGNVKRVRKAQPRSTKALAKLYGNGTDRLDVLRRTERSFQDEWRTRWFDEAARHVRFDLLPERWYVSYRLGHWNGPLAQSKPGYINVVPLLSAGAVRKGLELSADARRSERLHFEVIRRAAPELAQVPFMGDTWDPMILESSPIPLPKDPFPTRLAPTDLVLKRPKWDFVADQGDAIRRLLAEAGQHAGLDAICDVAKLQDVSHRNDLGPGEMMELYASIGAALALLGRAEPIVDQPRGKVST